MRNFGYFLIYLKLFGSQRTTLIGKKIQNHWFKWGNFCSPNHLFSSCFGSWVASAGLTSPPLSLPSRSHGWVVLSLSTSSFEEGNEGETAKQKLEREVREIQNTLFRTIYSVTNQNANKQTFSHFMSNNSWTKCLNLMKLLHITKGKLTPKHQKFSPAPMNRNWGMVARSLQWGAPKFMSIKILFWDMVMDLRANFLLKVL